MSNGSRAATQSKQVHNHPFLNPQGSRSGGFLFLQTHTNRRAIMKNWRTRLSNAATYINHNKAEIRLDAVRVTALVGLVAVSIYRALQPQRVIMQFDVSALTPEDADDFFRVLNAT